VFILLLHYTADKRQLIIYRTLNKIDRYFDKNYKVFQDFIDEMNRIKYDTNNFEINFTNYSF
jgi:hypothetical protein